MESLTLTPVGPWHAAHTVATFALPASISAPCATGATSRRKDIPSAFFMGLLQVRLVGSNATVYAFVEGVNSSRSWILPQRKPFLANRGVDVVYLMVCCDMRAPPDDLR